MPDLDLKHCAHLLGASTCGNPLCLTQGARPEGSAQEWDFGQGQEILTCPGLRMREFFLTRLGIHNLSIPAHPYTLQARLWTFSLSRQGRGQGLLCLDWPWTTRDCRHSLICLPPACDHRRTLWDLPATGPRGQDVTSPLCIQLASLH